MDCNVTCFERVMNQVHEVPNSKIKEACAIITEDGLRELLDFGVENECFTEAQASTLYDGIIMWEDLNGNYYEEDDDKLNVLIEAMGISDSDAKDYQEKEAEKEELMDEVQDEIEAVLDKMCFGKNRDYDYKTVDALIDPIIDIIKDDMEASESDERLTVDEDMVITAMLRILSDD